MRCVVGEDGVTWFTVGWDRCPVVAWLCGAGWHLGLPGGGGRPLDTSQFTPAAPVSGTIVLVPRPTNSEVSSCKGNYSSLQN